MIEEIKQDVFEFLDELRESGKTNMFGAVPYIQADFLLDRQEAETLLKEWMRTFSERHPSQ